MDAVYYFGSLIIGLSLLALQGLIALVLIEVGYRIYCKIKGQEN